MFPLQRTGTHLVKIYICMKINKYTWKFNKHELKLGNAFTHATITAS
jgi:hypothetical protein